MSTPTTEQVTTKFIVAVHGIGDQTMFGTIKSAAFRFFSYRGATAGIPLGSFHTAQLTGAGAPFLDIAVTSQKKIRLRFAEAYWASVPRELVKEGFTLEESKAWAQTVVERFRARYDRKQEEDERRKKEEYERRKKEEYERQKKEESERQKKEESEREKKEESERKPKEEVSATLHTKLEPEDFSRVKQILLEMIESIRILERLVMLAEKAGLFKFNLRKVLDDYVGDVQIVADFQKPRSEILARFLRVMRAVYEADKNAEIYIVAHSEGTVVAFLGLVTAMRDGGKDNEWVRQVKGLMTFGSPLDKHLLLWPELFEEFELKGNPKERAEQQQSRVVPENPLRWKNYYDYGDPIGFNLGKIRGWLSRNGWKNAFDFKDEDDYEFSRYWLPGKAHTDYWQDKDVFGHFIQEVVGVPGQSLNKKQASDFSQPPKTERLRSFAASYLVPYFLFFALSFGAIFILRKGVLECISPDEDPAAALRVLKNVGCAALALCGLTAMAGIFRLTHMPRWRVRGALLFVTLVTTYWWFRWPSSRARDFLYCIIARKDCTTVAKEASVRFDSRSLVTLVVVIISAGLLVLVANWAIKKWPAFGLKPLLVLLGAPVAVFIAAIVHSQPDRESVWPLLLSGAAAVYLWWLAAILFDLVFIWHYYIRHEAAMNRLREPTLKDPKRPVIQVVPQPKTTH